MLVCKLLVSLQPPPKGGVASPELAWPTDLSNFGGRCFVCDLPQALTELLGSA